MNAPERTWAQVGNGRISLLVTDALGQQSVVIEAEIFLSSHTSKHRPRKGLSGNVPAVREHFRKISNLCDAPVDAPKQVIQEVVMAPVRGLLRKEQRFQDALALMRRRASLYVLA